MVLDVPIRRSPGVPAVRVGRPEDEMPSLRMQQDFMQDVSKDGTEFRIPGQSRNETFKGKRVEIISRVLDELYPDPPIPLHFKKQLHAPRLRSSWARRLRTNA